MIPLSGGLLGLKHEIMMRPEDNWEGKGHTMTDCENSVKKVVVRWWPSQQMIGSDRVEMKILD